MSDLQLNDSLLDSLELRACGCSHRNIELHMLDIFFAGTNINVRLIRLLHQGPSYADNPDLEVALQRQRDLPQRIRRLGIKLNTVSKIRELK